MPLRYEEFDPAWGEYDELTSRLYGFQPVDGHGQSRVPYGPDEGLFLKSEKHPTFFKSVFVDMMSGGRFYRNKQNGRVYSFEPDRDVGPEFEELEWNFAHSKFVPKRNRKNKARSQAVENVFATESE